MNGAQSLDEVVRVPYYEDLVYDEKNILTQTDYSDRAEYILNIPSVMLPFKETYLDNIKCIKVKGEGMLPRFSDGDYIFVDVLQKEINNEGIYLILVDHMLLIKTVQWIPGGIRLISENQKFAPIDLTELQGYTDSIETIGRVIAAFTYS